jgi:isopropylmalate/homocitrate/citramalate synthase
VDHGADIVEMPFVFSDSQMCLYDSMAGARISREEAIDRALKSVVYAKSKAPSVCCLIEDFMRMDLGFFKSVARKMVEAGATIIRLDTSIPHHLPAYRYVVRDQGFPDITVRFTHTTTMGWCCCTHAGVEGGAEIIDASVNGLVNEPIPSRRWPR